MADEVVRRIIIEGRTSGVSEVVAQLQKLSSAQDGVTAASEKTERVTRSVENALERERLSLVDGYRELRQFESSYKNITNARAQGLIGQAEEAQLLQRAVARYQSYGTAVGQGARATQQFGTQAGLARHELVNLSRQAQDLAVSLGSGQSFGTVLLQQGTQIADVFANSQGTVAGFFGQLTSSAGRVITPLRLVSAGVLSIGTAAIFAAADWSSSQQDISRSLQGIGRASGATVSDINRIGYAASSAFGLSVSEASKVASTLASTGRIGAREIQTLTSSARDFAATLNVDVGDAAKQLATIFADPVKGVDEISAKIGGISPLIREQIGLYDQVGNRVSAQRVLIQATVTQLAKANEVTGFWATSWNAIGNFASNAWTAFGKVASSVTGIGKGDAERLRELEATIGRLAQTLNNASSDYPLLGRVREELSRTVNEYNRLKASIDANSLQQSTQAFLDLANKGQQFADVVNTDAARVRELNAQIQVLQTVLSSPNRDLVLSSDQVAQWQQGLKTLQSQKATVDELKASYGGVSLEIAGQLANLQAQLSVAQARTGQEQLSAQYNATITALKIQNRSDEEQIAVATAQRRVSEAAINTEADKQLKTLQDQAAQLSAATEEEKARVTAAQTYVNLINQGVDAQKAGAIAAQTIANARTQQIAQETAAADQQAATAAQQKANANASAAASAAREAANAARIAEEYEQISRLTRYIPNSSNLGGSDYVLGKNIYQTSGGYSQFNPQGYKSSTPTASSLNNPLGSSNFDATTGFPTKSYYESLGDQLYGSGNYTVLSAGGGTYTLVPDAGSIDYGDVVDAALQQGGVSGAIDSILGGALGTVSGDDAQDYLSRLYDLLTDQSAKQSVLEREIASIKTEPVTLAREELLADLNTSLQELTGSVDNMTDVLSPYYSSDPRNTHLGYRNFAEGGIMTKWGELPLRHYDGGGVTTTPQVFTTSEYFHPEAIIPLDSGAVPVKLTGSGASSQTTVINQTFNISGSVDRATRSKVKLTQYQEAQRLARMLGK